MDKYTIYCTEEQTKKAFELGAPIEVLPNYMEFENFPFVNCKDGNQRPCMIPTAEQMICWLEEQELNFEGSSYYMSVEIKNGDNIGIYSGTRKEATLAAIDVALEYLSENKQ